MSVWIDHTHSAFVSSDKRSFDVIVVGAGIAGVSCCYWLRRSGFKGSICLLDRRGIALAATGRNGGHLWADSVVQPESDCFDLILEFVQSNAKEKYFDICESVELVRAKEDFEMYDERLQRIDEEVLLDRFIPFLKRGQFAGGVVEKKAGMMNAYKLCNGIFAATENIDFLKANVLCRKRNVLEVVINDGRKEEVRFGKVIFCTNGWTRELFPELEMTPIRGQVAAVKCEEKLKHGLSIDGSCEYIIPTEQGFVIGGGRNQVKGREEGETDDSKVNPAIDLRIEIEKTFDLKQGYEITHHWTGIMAFTPDGMPYVGKLSSDNEFISACFNGHGMPRAFIAGKYLAELIVEQKDSIPKEWNVRRKLRSHL